MRGRFSWQVSTHQSRKGVSVSHHSSSCRVRECYQKIVTLQSSLVWKSRQHYITTKPFRMIKYETAGEAVQVTVNQSSSQTLAHRARGVLEQPLVHTLLVEVMHAWQNSIGISFLERLQTNSAIIATCIIDDVISLQSCDWGLHYISGQPVNLNLGSSQPATAILLVIVQARKQLIVITREVALSQH